MNFILFYLFFGLLWLISLLPLRLLFGISDLFFPVFYYLVQYRKNVVLKNLRNSFPEWDEKKIKKVSKRFYHYFFDLLIESIAGSFLSKNNMSKRYVLRNPELCNDLYEKGKSISLVMSHYGNWEWIGITQLFLKHQILAIYKPLHNHTLDKLFKKSRERFGLLAVPMAKILRVLVEYESKNIPTLTLFLADQRPLLNIIQYWLKFMNQLTPVVLGPEKISKKMDMAVVYFKIIPVKRGYYEAEFILLFEDAKNTAPYEITKRYHEVLEETIKENPDYWLWTHNRWKHKRADFDRLFGNKKKMV